MSRSDQNNMEAIAILWTRAQPIVSTFIFSIVPRFQDADDILQQVAVAVVKNFDKYDKNQAFVGWAIGIAKHEILMYRRKHAQHRLIFDTAAIEKISRAYEGDPVQSNDIQKALETCIRNLKGSGKQIVEMRYLSEWSVSRMAQKLGMTQGAIYTALHRIRLSLQKCINKQLFTEDTEYG